MLGDRRLLVGPRSEHRPSTWDLTIRGSSTFIPLNSRLEGNKEEKKAGGGAHLVEGREASQEDVEDHARRPPHTLHPTPYTLHPAPYTLHPTPCTLHPTPYTLSLNPESSTVNTGAREDGAQDCPEFLLNHLLALALAFSLALTHSHSLTPPLILTHSLSLSFSLSLSISPSLTHPLSLTLRAKREQLKRFNGQLPDSQGLALTVLHVSLLYLRTWPPRGRTRKVAIRLPGKRKFKLPSRKAGLLRPSR